ncbi:MAG: hypothetical protein H6549_12865 [Chitinophagales bacterium]|nr:hypothetical protein [Chitinophagales bacterium]
MKEWELIVRFGRTVHGIKAQLEYESAQIMRFRVWGTKGSMLLENNYPTLFNGKSKRGVQWKIREGAMTEGTEQTSQLLIDIFSQLEKIMKDYLEGKERQKFRFD